MFDMEKPMKRKQFHLTEEDDNMLKELAQYKGTSEAEIVREAIRDYATKIRKQKNPLLDMVKEAEKHSVDSVEDLAEKHDEYLWRNEGSEKK